jgi:hypothetical protein
MKFEFNTEQEARDFFLNKTQDLNQIQTEIISTISDDILSQEHYSFYDFSKDTKHRFSIYETLTGFEVHSHSIKLSQLVLAAELGDLKLFQHQLNNNQTVKALSLAFVRAIENENTNILQFYFQSELFDSLNLYKKPIIYCTYSDRLNSFLFFIRKGEVLPINIFGHIFLNNAIKILSYILDDPRLCGEVMQEKYMTKWALVYLQDERRENEATRMFKKRKNSS